MEGRTTFVEEEASEVLLDSVDRLLTMSAFEAAHALRSFRVRHPNLSNEKLIETARAVNVNFFPHDYTAGVALEQCVPHSLGDDLETFFTAAIDAIIEARQPFWVRLAPGGRNTVCAALDENGRQCFRNAGLLGTSERAIAWWDRMATSVRMAQDTDRLAQGRKGERLSFEREKVFLKERGIDKEPLWMALDDNSLGYDILSYRWHGDHVVNRLIEVKTTYSKPPRLILTRNEWQSVDRFRDAFKYHVWALPEETSTVKSVEDVRPHIPSDAGDGEWLDAEIVWPAKLPDEA